MVSTFLKSNWPEIGSVFIALISAIAGLVAHQSAKRQAKINVNLSITEAHQELWGRFLSNPALARVTSDLADIEAEPVTAEEEAFVLLLMAHLSTTLAAIRQGKHTAPEGMLADVTKFYSKPVPRKVLQQHFEAQPALLRTLLRAVESNTHDFPPHHHAIGELDESNPGTDR